LDVRRNDRDPLGGEPLRGGLTDSLRGTGDDPDLPV